MTQQKSKPDDRNVSKKYLENPASFEATTKSPNLNYNPKDYKPYTPTDEDYIDYGKNQYKKKNKKSIIKSIIIITAIIGIGLILYNTNFQLPNLDSTQLPELPSIPQIIPSSTSPTISQLREYALQEINRERTKHGLTNVTLSPIECAQNHADNLLKGGYLSHWDTEGWKPYMRYTRDGGKGMMGENCAWMHSTGEIDPYKTIKELNWNMIYDDANSNWGHRDNLLDPKHNRVSLGIAYDDSNLYLVQDFEDYYFTSTEIQRSGSIINIMYTSIKTTWKPEQIAIFYDPIPQPLTESQLRSSPYNHGYDQGTYVAGVVTEGWYMQQGITINANIWRVSGNTFQTKFDLSKVFNAKGKGVYTLCIADSEGYWTNISIWNK
ncbi:MAG: CAP domain-containing protein [Deltaproteobacteria bacterium]|nr:CAP domain-containing protein [Deltaproteobacteria bacterium]